MDRAQSWRVTRGGDDWLLRAMLSTATETIVVHDIGALRPRDRSVADRGDPVTVVAVLAVIVARGRTSPVDVRARRA